MDTRNRPGRADIPVDGDPTKTKPMLVDGRNRRAACKLAGVEIGDKSDRCWLDSTTDPTAYVLSANIHRRHMTKGQRAMVVAKVRLVSNQSVRGIANQSGLDHTRVFERLDILLAYGCSARLR